MTCNHPHRQNGNALFLILIAVALFAALSYAVTQSGRGAGGIDKETTLIAAANIMNYSASLQTAIQRMRIADNVTDVQFRFTNVNANCTTTSCRVFDPAGGGLNDLAPNATWLDTAFSAEGTYGQWVYSGGHNVVGVGSDGGAAANSELIAVLPWVKKAICLEINNKLGVTNPSGDAPVDLASYSTSPFTGTYGTGEIADAGAVMNGQFAACFKATNVSGVAKANSYHFYQVLLPR